MHAFLRDVSWAGRALRATPAAALAAILTIALGTGANTAVVAIAYGVLLRPLPCPEPARIVVVSVHGPNGNEIGEFRAFELTVPIRWRDIPQVLKDAVVAVEDRNFWEHDGVDPEAIVLGGGLSQIGRLYERVPDLLPLYVFSDAVATPVLAPRHGDSSGVRGAAWLWPPGSDPGPA